MGRAGTVSKLRTFLFSGSFYCISFFRTFFRPHNAHAMPMHTSSAGVGDVIFESLLSQIIHGPGVSSKIAS
jgi:hypothetical protein